MGHFQVEIPTDTEVSLPNHTVHKVFLPQGLAGWRFGVVGTRICEEPDMALCMSWLTMVDTLW